MDQAYERNHQMVRITLEAVPAVRLYDRIMTRSLTRGIVRPVRWSYLLGGATIKERNTRDFVEGLLSNISDRGIHFTTPKAESATQGTQSCFPSAASHLFNRAIFPSSSPPLPYQLLRLSSH